MRTDPPTIALLDDPHTLAALAVDAQADGRVMVDRFVQEWTDGRNRFDQPGERAYIARIGDEIAAVCGLNRDPFANDPTVGRVRRLYVATARRRRGIGAAMIDRLMADAGGAFATIHLRTRDPIASAFYEAIGFARVEGEAECTHRRRVPRSDVSSPTRT